MAELKLSTIWEIKDYAEKNARIGSENEYCVFYSEDFTALEHESFPGLTWNASLYTFSPNETDCQKGFAGFGLKYSCDANVWATYSATVLDKNGCDLATFCSADAEYPNQVWKPDAFQIEDLSKAVRIDGLLRIRIDLSVLHIGEILKCRKLLRGLLTNRALVYFKVGAEEETFSLHKVVVAEASSVLADLFENLTAEKQNAVIPLPDTNPSAFKAFSEALYGDSWAFLNDIGLTQDVLYLAEKFKVADLKRHCDESLAEKVSDENALEVLTKTAAPCDAEKTKVACIKILVGRSEFKQSQIWLDFKKHNVLKALEILDTVSDKLSDTIDLLKCEHTAVASDLIRKHEQEQRECTERHVALESTLKTVKSTLLQKDLNLLVASVVESQLRADNARLEKGGGKLHERVIDLWCQYTRKGFENADLKTTLKRQDDKLKRAAVVESLLRTENARLEGKCVGLCERVDELQQQNAKGNLEVAGLKLLRKMQDDKASAVESRLRTENTRLEEKNAGFSERVCELEQLNVKGNLEVSELKTILGLRDNALNQASVVEAQLRTDIAQLEERRTDLTELVSELQQNAEESSELAKLKEECPVCMEQYSAERSKEVLYRCGHCFCSVCVDRVKNKARASRIGRDPVEFKCPICKAVFHDVVRPFTN